MRTLIALAMAGAMTCTAAYAQKAAAPRAAAIEGPEYVGVFEARFQGRRTPLERLPLQSRVRGRALGLAGSDIEQRVTGERSAVRFASGQPLVFVVRAESQANDPHGAYQILSMKRDKGHRVLTTGKVRWTTANLSAEQAVPFQAQRYGSQFFELTPMAALPPGEYMLRVTPNPNVLTPALGDAFLFGID